jgi:subtilase family serine protease
LSYKVLQLSPQASTDGIRSRTAIQDYWSASVEGSTEIAFLPSWMDDEIEADLAEGGHRSGIISGLALSAAFSASFWAAVALVVTRIWR